MCGFYLLSFEFSALQALGGLGIGLSAFAEEADSSYCADFAASVAVVVVKQGNHAMVVAERKAYFNRGVPNNERARGTSIHAVSELTQHSRRAIGAGAASSADGGIQQHIKSRHLACSVAQNHVFSCTCALALLALGSRWADVAASSAVVVGRGAHATVVAQSHVCTRTPAFTLLALGSCWADVAAGAAVVVVRRGAQAFVVAQNPVCVRANALALLALGFRWADVVAVSAVCVVALHVHAGLCTKLPG